MKSKPVIKKQRTTGPAATSQKRAILTIDDGPTQSRKAKVDVLHQRNIQALWFCSGGELELHRESAIYTIQKGGVIGNHSYSHPRFSDITIEQCKEEIAKTDEIIEHIYKDAGITRPGKFFRFPFGDKGGSFDYFQDQEYTEEGLIKKEEIQAFLKETGYFQPDFPNLTYPYYKQLNLDRDHDWFWTYDTLEWNIFSKTPAHPVSSIDDIFLYMEIDWPEKWCGLNSPDSDDIILIHDHHETAELFEAIIDKYLEKGIRFSDIPLK